VKISTILDKIDEKQLFVPAFQREYVWKREDAKQLIDSLIKEYPTGTLLTWETASPPELKGPHRYDSKQGAVRILLDGQQRATTLYMLIRGEIPPYYTLAEIMNDTRGLYVHLETRELSYYVKTRMENNPLWQNITDLFKRKFRARDIVRALEENGEAVVREREDRIDDSLHAIERILDRDFPEQTIPIKASIREAIDIFYKVNASGVALTDAELALAQISGYWPQARDIFKAKLAKLANDGFVLRLDFLVYALLGCMYHQGSEMRKLHGEENNERLREVWRVLDERLLDYVANLLRTHAFVDHTHEVSSIYALVPIIVFCFDKGREHPAESEIRKMVKWFYYSQIRTRYVSQLSQKLDRDLRVVQESPSPWDELLRVIEEEEGRLEILPGELEGRATQHPLFSLLRWYLKSHGAVCFTTGISIRKPMGKKYQLEYDHIFPYARLKKAGYGKGNRVKYALAQEFTNRAILTQLANRTKSDSEAAGYLRSVQARFPKALELQCIPQDESLWEIDRYEDFLEERRKLLAEHLTRFVTSITDTEKPATPVSIEDLVREGESEELEFKETLRWDVENRSVNKSLESAIVKAIAAFANGQGGGTLLIGVDDDGEICGLEHDYTSLSGDRDEFELHLRNILNRELGTAFVTSKVRVGFPAPQDREICQIDVAPASKPVFIEVADKDGRKSERFYVRSGNASQELSGTELSVYLKERF
jgi:hypothetical protein